MSHVPSKRSSPRGSTYENFVHPKDQEHYDEVARKFAARCEKRITEGGRPLGEPPKAKKTPAPETLDELIVQKIGLDQILKMKPKETEETVRARAEELGLPVDDGYGHEVVNRTWRDAQEKRQREVVERSRDSQIDTYEVHGDALELRIVLMAEDGHSPARITSLLRGGFPDLTIPDVARIIKDQEQPEQGLSATELMRQLNEPVGDEAPEKKQPKSKSSTRQTRKTKAPKGVTAS